MNTNNIPPNNTDSNAPSSHHHPGPKINHDLLLAPVDLQTPDNPYTDHPNHQDQFHNNILFTSTHTPQYHLYLVSNLQDEDQTCQGDDDEVNNQISRVVY